MGKRIDLTGQQFNEWTLIEWIPPNERETKSKDYIGQCSCGVCRPVRSNDVKQGKSKSCGHLKSNFHSINIGEKYGKITPIKQLTNKYGNPIQKYECTCECGNKVIFEADLIGKKKNCGCAFREGFDTLQDLTGKRYGKLVVLKLSDKTDSKGKHSFWDCQCDCGNFCTVYRGHLKDGHTSSCGCVKSFGEEKVAEILKRNGIEFKRQVKVEGIKDQNELPFDFGIYLQDKLIGLIEVQGKQHFDSSLLFSSEDLLYHDVIKEHQTRKMGIPLLLIDYSGGQENTDFNKIEKDIISFIGGI